MGLSVGVDIVKVDRLRKAVERWGMHFLLRVFTEEELSYCEGKAKKFEHLAARFAAKEAIIKALRERVPLKSIILKNSEDGAPQVYILNKKKKISISISHTKEFAIAFCVIEDEDSRC